MASKKSPRRIPEAQRHTEQVKLRLPPDVAREIRALSAASGVQVSTLVALAWAVARRSGGLAAALATVARAAGCGRSWAVPHHEDGARARGRRKKAPAPVKGRAPRRLGHGSTSG